MPKRIMNQVLTESPEGEMYPCPVCGASGIDRFESRYGNACCHRGVSECGGDGCVGPVQKWTEEPIECECCDGTGLLSRLKLIEYTLGVNDATE